jgi:hypothetical protein
MLPAGLSVGLQAHKECSAHATFSANFTFKLFILDLWVSLLLLLRVFVKGAKSSAGAITHPGGACGALELHDYPGR